MTVPLFTALGAICFNSILLWWVAIRDGAPEMEYLD